MKLAWALIITGILLILDGTARMYLSFVLQDNLFFMGGFLTGWLLGSFLLYRGIKRYKYKRSL